MSNNLQVSLFERSDLAAEVGFLIMYTANLEAFLPPVLATLLRCPEPAARQITEQVDNVSAKLSIMFAIAEQKPRSPKARVVVESKAAILEAVALRNKLAHGLYGIDVWHDVTLATNVISGGRRSKPDTIRLVPSAVRKVSERLRATMERLEREVCPPRGWEQYEALARASRNKRAQATQPRGKRRKAQPDP